MAENCVQLPVNSTGTKMRTFEQTVGSNVVDHQAVVLCDSSGNIIGSLASSPTGSEQGLVVRNIPSGTQAVSLATAPTTPVTGTFWQATQPVSLATAPTTPVTGTFWQTTQPVSLASAPTTPVTGTFWQATQPVSVAALPALATGSNTIGVVNSQFPINQSVDGTGAAQPMQFAYFNVSTAQTGVSLISAPASGRSIRVISYAIVVGATMNVSLIGPTTTLLFPLAANGGVSFAGTLQGPAFQCAAATALTYTTSAAGQATGHICYVVV